MIPHHQVAIDMCNLMKPISKSKSLHYIYKIIIFNQNIEIFLMKNVIKSIPSLSNESNILYRNSKFKHLSLLIRNQSLKTIIVTLYFLNQMTTVLI